VLNISNVFELSVRIARWLGFRKNVLQTWLRAERTVSASKKKIPLQDEGEMAH